MRFKLNACVDLSISLFREFTTELKNAYTCDSR